MSGETPIYDATCRDVGPPGEPEVDGASTGRPPGEQGRSAGAWPHDPDEDPVTSDLAIPGGDPSSPDAEGSGVSWWV